MTDQHHVLSLRETAVDSATFLSEAQLIVVGDQALKVANPGYQMDNAFAVYSVEAGNVVPDNQPNDRTHRALLEGGGQVFFTIPGCTDGDPRAVMRPVSDPRRDLAPPHAHNPDGVRVARIRVRVNLEPFEDTGYTHTWTDAWGDPQQENINANATNRIKEDAQGLYYDRDMNGQRDADDWPIIEHGGTRWSWKSWKVSVDISKNGVHDNEEPFCDRGFDFRDRNVDKTHQNGEVSERFRNLSSFQWAPAEDPPDWLRGDDEEAGSWGTVATPAQISHQITAANVSWAQAAIRIVQVGPIHEHHYQALGISGWFEPWMRDNWSTAVNILDPQPTPDIAEVLFTGPMNGFLGIAFIPLEHSGPNPPFYAENSYCFIGANPLGNRRTLAHELGHLLTNRFDPTAPVQVPSYLFFPSQEALPDETPVRIRRLYHEHEGGQQDARTIRQINDLSGAGSRFLSIP